MAATHPHLFISEEDRGSGTTVAELRKAIESGIHQTIWNQIRELSDREIGQPPLLASTPLPGRPEEQALNNDPDYNICHAVGQRLLRHALLALVTDEPQYKATYLNQLSALYDEEQWPPWISQAHVHFGYPAGLRTGMLSQSIGISYDWIYPRLSSEEREMVIEGLDRRGIQPYLQSLEMDPWWMHDLHNWFSVIVGGLGVAGMGLNGDHPQSEELVELACPGMEAFLETYGREGEFNESVGYCNATRIPVAFYYALQCHWRGETEYSLCRHPFPQTAVWTLHCTAPPGHLIAFGDGHLDNPPQAPFLAAIAAANQDPVLQGFVLAHLQPEADPLALLWIDASLDAKSPEGVIPRGKAYQDNGAILSSRSDWNYRSTPSLVTSKAKRDLNHDHNDLGQLCIDGFGERLITDLGNPSGYPADFFEAARWKYYNASVTGHNILQFGEREQKVMGLDRGVREQFDFSTLNGVIVRSAFDDKQGGCWRIDLTPAYEGVESVFRTVVHLLPGIVACLDEAMLPEETRMRLRWHTITPAPPQPDGHFFVAGEKSGLSAQVVTLEPGDSTLAIRRHEYREPYHLNRSNVPLVQRREPYVEWSCRGNQFRVLTLFAVLNSPNPFPKWRKSSSGWEMENPLGHFRVGLDSSTLSAVDVRDGRQMAISLQDGTVRE